MQFNPAGGGNPPIVAFDVGSESDGHDLLALMVWPADPIRRKQWLAAHTTMVIENLGQPPPHLAELDLRLAEAEAEQTGHQPQDIIADWHGLRRQEWGAWLRELGGPSTVVRAPALDAMEAEMMTAVTGGARRAGELLLVMACMEEHHRDVSPSLNRAMAVIEARYKKTAAGVALPGSNERALKDSWARWRPVAPLWAALVFFYHASRRVGGLPSPFLNRPSRFLMLSSAGWFRQFATTYKPLRASEPLIVETECIRVDCGIEAAKPELQRLPPDLLAVAKSYRVKAVKQGY